MGGVTAVEAGPTFSLFVTEDATLYATGKLEPILPLGRLTRPARIATGVRAVSTGGLHILVLTMSSRVRAIGHNLFGQLGTGKVREEAPHFVMQWEEVSQFGTEYGAVAAVAAGAAHSLFLRED